MTKVPRGKKLIIYTDGASRGNPGHSSFATLMKDEDDIEYHRHSEYLGTKTNNQSEMLAIKYALNKAIEFTRNNIKLYSDSECSVNWLTGVYCVRSVNIRPIFDEIQILINNFVKVEFQHVSRNNPGVAECDKMCNECLDNSEGKR